MLPRGNKAIFAEFLKERSLVKVIIKTAIKEVIDPGKQSWKLYYVRCFKKDSAVSYFF